MKTFEIHEECFWLFRKALPFKVMPEVVPCTVIAIIKTTKWQFNTTQYRINAGRFGRHNVYGGSLYATEEQATAKLIEPLTEYVEYLEKNLREAKNALKKIVPED